MQEPGNQLDRVRHKLVVPAVHGFIGVQLTALFFAVQAVLMLVAWTYADGLFEPLFVLVGAGLYAYIAWGLTRAEKSAWHLAAFFAFVGIVLNLLSVACAPGELADGNMSLLDVAGDMLMLVLSILVWGYIRRDPVREVFGVPTYPRHDEDDY